MEGALYVSLSVRLIAQAVSVTLQRCLITTPTTRRQRTAATNNDRTDHICQDEAAAAATCLSAFNQRH